MLKNQKKKVNVKNRSAGITLIALIITTIFSYDKKLRYSNKKGFLLVTI